MNKLLTNLYASKWDDLSSRRLSILEDETYPIKPENPLIICVEDEEGYRSAEIRLVVYGQETNCWTNDKFVNGYGSIVELLEHYNTFFNKEECRSYGGQFWNGVSRFKGMLQSKFPDKKIRLIWNNIVKIGKKGDKGFPPQYIHEVERQHFQVIPEELEILNSNVVLFLTGPNYDNVIKENFRELEYEAVTNFTSRQLSRVKLESIPFVYRTYHPNYLWRKGINWYFEAIVKEIEL